MAAWELPAALVSLRAEFNALAPARDKASDGSIGDTAHAASVSDHNVDDGPGQGATPSEDADSVPEVHAIDVDADLRRVGWSMAMAVSIIVGRHRTGLDGRLQNVIYNGRIYSRSWGWTSRPYEGSNPHDKHAHFSLRYTDGAEDDTRPWGLLAAAGTEEDDGMGIDEFFASVGRSVRGESTTDQAQADRTNRKNFADATRFALGLNYEADRPLAEMPAGQLERIAGALERMLAAGTDGNLST